MFWHKKNLPSDEYESLSKKITDLSQQIQQLKSGLTEQESLLHSLRGLVNRKISGTKKEEENDEEEKGINNTVILPYNGAFR